MNDPLPTLLAACPTAFTTASGRRIDLTAPTPDDICVDDICHHLAGINRYGGALVGRFGEPIHYSVAEHTCYVVAAALEGLPRDAPDQLIREVALAALLHDAPEAYVGDMIAPLKQALRTPGNRSIYDHLEATFDWAIGVKFGSNPRAEVAERVHAADQAVYAAESFQLRGWRAHEFEQHAGGQDLYRRRWRGAVRGISPADAKRELLEMFAVVHADGSVDRILGHVDARVGG